MSGVLTRRGTSESGVAVRYTPCAKSERPEEEVPAEEEEDDEEEEQQEKVSILRHSQDDAGAGRPAVRPTVGRFQSSGSVGSGSASGSGSGSVGRYRIGYSRAAEFDTDLDPRDDDTDGRDSLELRGGTVASIDSGDLELSECAHLRRPNCGPFSATGSAGRTDDSASGGSAPVPGTSSQQTPTANGPRHLPGLDLNLQDSARTRLIGERLSSTDKISLSSPIYSSRVVEQQRAKSQSRQSLIEIVSSKLERVRQRKRFSLAQGSLVKKPRLSEAHIVTNRITRRQRRKDIEEKFGKRKSIRGDQTHRIETATSVSSDHEGCNWTFVFDPSGRLCYWWSSVVSVAFLYNFWVIIYRFAFQEINQDNIAIWFTLDYTADLLYVLDIAFHFRTGYLEDGVLQTDPVKLRIHYTNTTTFYIDCLCLLPLDFLYLSIGFCSILRGFRLVKVYRFWAFMDRTERHTNYPNVIRATTLMHYMVALFHWNACLYYIVARSLDRPHDEWRFPKEQGNSMAIQYLHALHRSLITLTTIGQPPTPITIGEYLFVVFEMIFALVLFATFLGHIANIVTNVSAARKEFQARLDGVKTYMNLRRVPLKLQDRVIKWFDYLWMCNKSSDEEKALSLLPDKLKAEIAIHVHLDTLKRVEIFQNTEAGFLCELVLRLRPVLFSPGDYICRNGEVGKEMYIVNRGRLHVVADNGKTVLATLKPGSYFGEISILNMGTAGNRRTASVRSVGYSDLFCLSKKDLWDVLKEYPAARVKLEAIAVKRLAKYKKQPLEKALERSRSTPGLVESAGKVPLDAMFVHRHHTLPAGLLSGSGDNAQDRADLADAERRRKLESTQSEDNLLTRCVEEAQRRMSTDSQHEAVCNLTTSTVTSYNGTPPLRSPTTAAEVSKSPFTPPSSPKPSTGPPASTALPLPPFQQLQQQYGAYVSITGASTLVGDPHLQQQMSYATYPPGSFPFVNTPQGPVTYLTPYSAALTYPPSPSLSAGLHGSQPVSAPTGGAPLAANHLAASQTSLHPPPAFPHSPTPTGTLLPPSHSSHPVSPLLAASPLGVGSPSRGENQTEIMLKEISRLRERLAQLEGENTALTVKLNQQQWDVENRLIELEMHLGQSDSVASTDVSDDRGGGGGGGGGGSVGGGSGSEARYSTSGERAGTQSSTVPPIVTRESII